MATTFSIEHTWPVDRSVVIEHLFDDALGDKTNEAIKSADRRRLSVEERDGKTVQRFEVKVKEVPAAARKVFKALEWVEESTYDPKTERFAWRILPTVMKDKITCDGELWYDAAGEGKTRRVVTGRVQIKVPLVGGTIEKIIVDQLKRSYEDASKAESAYFQAQS